MNKLLISLAVFLLVVASTSTVLAKEGGSGHGRSGNSGGDNRVRIEVRDDNELGEDRFRFEARSDDNRVRIEIRGDAEDELPNFEIEGNTFEITGTVTVFTGGTVTINGRTITIDPAGANFEQEGTIEVGEVVKVEGMVSADGSLVAREIKANGIEEEVSLSGSALSALLNQIMVLLRNVV
ncbi:hypothetical protein HYU95_04695 [Candidatus Daviesbacteria bacterium]|nr:hypothetical protein [Candidatus Daviesbacteria bacterium]